jgi:RNA polymerase sigma-70 factor (ECF subfamily)
VHRKETDASSASTAADPGGTRPDAELLAAIATGDKQALARLYDRHAPRLLSLAGRLMRSPVDAEDLLHDLFLEVYHRASTYDPARGSVPGWLVMRLRSRAIDRLRSPIYRRLVALDGELPALHDTREPALLDASEPLCGALKRALSDLPQDTQAILNLVYFKGMSLPEVASSMFMPLGTVKSRLHRALRSLRAAVGDIEDRSP